MSAQWLYAVDGVQYGPVTQEDLQRFLAEGRLKADDHVWTEGMPQWIEARQVASLTAPAVVVAATPFFPVSSTKFVIMYLGTFGIYEIYWMYKQWVAIRARTRADMMPFWRAIFAVFFFHSLVGEVNDEGTRHGFPEHLATAPLTILFVLTSIAWRLPDPFWLITFLSIIPVLIVQRRMNAINAAAAPLLDRNSRIHGWNWLAVVVGMPLCLFTIWVTIFSPA